MKLVSLTILLLLSYCSTMKGNDFTRTGGPKKMEGWAGPPDNLHKKPYEYFYTKYIAAAKPDTVKSKDSKRMKDSCIESCTLYGKANYLRIMVRNNTGDDCKYDESDECLENSRKEDSYILNWIHETKLVKEQIVFNCKPRGDASKFSGSEWTQCECINDPPAKSK